jgi:haloalkane dehalogenase
MSAGALALDPPASGSPPLAGYPFAGHALQLDGARLHYLDEGPRGADPIVFVHGNPTWSYLWRRPIAALSARHRCIAPDHVGMGRSDKPAGYPYRLAQHVANLERLLLELDLRRATLVVHDWGGPIGLGAFLRHPERLARVLITNTAAFPLSSFGGRAPWRLRACRVPVLGELAVRGLNAFAGLAVHLAVARPLAPEVRAGYLAPYASFGERIATHRFVRDIPLSPAHPSYGALLEVEAALPRLARVPASIVWGERDWCFTPAFRREWQRRLPHAAVRALEHAGHYLVEDAPEEFQQELEALLARPA